jgi:hypothetical protein
VGVPRPGIGDGSRQRKINAVGPSPGLGNGTRQRKIDVIGVGAGRRADNIKKKSLEGRRVESLTDQASVTVIGRRVVVSTPQEA